MGIIKDLNIEIEKGHYLKIKLENINQLPIEKWPYVMKIDFINTIEIFYNLGLIPDKEFIKYSSTREEVYGDLMSLKEFV